MEQHILQPWIYGTTLVEAKYGKPLTKLLELASQTLRLDKISWVFFFFQLVYVGVYLIGYVTRFTSPGFISIFWIIT
jgi:hypothetical protein